MSEIRFQREKGDRPTEFDYEAQLFRFLSSLSDQSVSRENLTKFETTLRAILQTGLRAGVDGVRLNAVLDDILLEHRLRLQDESLEGEYIAVMTRLRAGITN